MADKMIEQYEKEHYESCIRKDISVYAITYCI